MRNLLSLPRRCFVLLLLSAIASPAAAGDGLADEARPDSWKSDAALTDVTFIDRQNGWAVGSHGVLLRTEDGGKTWTEGGIAQASAEPQRQAPLTEKFQQVRSGKRGSVASGTRSSTFSCRFETVCFNDAKNGWAAGGYDLPDLDYSRGVVARTLDGGKSWQALPQLMIGRIQKFDLQGLSGWAVGQTNPATNTSLFFTSDAGNIWSSQKSKKMPDLIDAEPAGNRFVGIDRHGQPLHFDTAESEYSAFTGSRDAVVLADISMVDAKHGYAVGSGGALLSTNNAGLSWSPVSENKLLANFDFRCVHAGKDKVWLGGDPGNVLFSLDRESGELKTHVLAGAAAINAIHFVDAEFGWAVGDFGRIYATVDGGATWRMQRSGTSGSFASVMVVASDDRDLPLELIAKQGGEDGKLIGVLSPQNENIDSVRMAAERIGAAVVSPIGNENKTVFIRRIVRTIRLWKPSIVVGASKDDLLPAIRLAADSTAFPEQLTAGLETWQAKYLMVADQYGPIEFENSVFLPRIGSLLEDFALPSRMLCGLPVTQNGSTAFFAWKLVGQGPSAKLVQLDQSPFSLASFSKRRKKSIPIGSLSSVAQISQKHQQIKWLLDQKIESVLDLETCKRRIAQLGFQLRATPEGDYLAGVWLLQLADRYRMVGLNERASFALQELAKSHPNHCLAPLASTQLARYYSSSEFNRLALANWQSLRSNIGQANAIPGASAGPQGVAIEQTNHAGGRTEYRWSKVNLAVALEEAAAAPLDIGLGEKIDVAKELENFDPATVDLSLDVSPPEPQPDPKTTPPPATSKRASMTHLEKDAYLRGRLRLASSHFTRVGRRDPGLAKRADFLYLQAHIVEQLGGIEQAKPYYQNVLKSKSLPAFASAAREMIQSGGAATQVIIATERPHLDGIPNDSVWEQVMQQKQTLTLERQKNSVGNDVVMIARDDQYLYLYARCYKFDRFRYREAAETLRQRDANLSRQDRVEFRFDVDHDLVSAWKVEVDWRGEVFESCGEDTSWNPKMFVARHLDDRVWSIECAIRIDDLTKSLKASDAWRFNVRRTAAPRSTESVDVSEIVAGQLLSFPE